MKKFCVLPLLFLFFGLFLIYPLLSLLQGAFWVESVGTDPVIRHFSLEYFGLILTNPFYRDCLLNSLAIASWTTFGGLAVALPMAQLFQRTRFPGQSLFNVLILVPLILPPFVGAIGLKQLLARFGSINLLLMQLRLIDRQHPIDWLGQGGFGGVIVLEILHLFPIVFISLQAALKKIDPSLREAGQNLGSSGWHLFLQIILPLLMPSIFASGSLVFISAFTDLGLPLMFNLTSTLPIQIYNLVTQTDNPMGSALVVLTLIVVGGLFLLGRSWGEGHSLLSRGASVEDRVTLRGWSAASASGLVTLWIGLSILPHLGVLVESVSARWFFSVLPSEWTTQHYQEVCSLPLTVASLQNSLQYSALSSALDLVLGTLIAYLLARETFVGRGLLDLLATLPLALPGLVSAFAYFVAFSRGPFPKSFVEGNHLWLACFDPRSNPTLILVVAYALHRLPFLVRSVYAGLQQTSPALEEASRNLGAGLMRTLGLITLPLIGAHLVAGFIMTFAFAMLDVSNGMILAQETRFYPLTKATFSLLGRILPTAPSQACALGVLSMIFLGTSLALVNYLFRQDKVQTM